VPIDLKHVHASILRADRADQVATCVRRRLICRLGVGACNGKMREYSKKSESFHNGSVVLLVVVLKDGRTAFATTLLGK